MEITELDKQILYELDLDASQSVADLARKLGVSRDRILYRLKQLQGEGVLLGFGAAVNLHKLGLYLYKTYLRIEKNERRSDELLAALRNHPRVSWFAETEGKWDLMFSIGAHDPVEFHEMQGALILDFSDIIINYSVYTMVEAFCFAKSYLVGVGTNHYRFGGRVENVTLDGSDIEILRLLATDCRIPKSEIANQLGVSPMVIKYRLDRLEQQGVIVGYPINLDLAKLGMMLFKLQIQFGTYERHSEQQLLEYCKSNPNVVLFVRQIGDCMIELEMEVESYQALHQVIGDIRKLFSRFVRSIEPIFIRSQQYKWVPFGVEHLEEGALGVSNAW